MSHLTTLTDWDKTDIAELLRAESMRAQENLEKTMEWRHDFMLRSVEGVRQQIADVESRLKAA